MTMKLEVGKYYVTRNGKKVRIYATDGNGCTPVHGAVYTDGWTQLRWALDGLRLSHGREQYDIVGPWEEPLREIWVGELNNGGLSTRNFATPTEVFDDNGFAVQAIKFREVR